MSSGSRLGDYIRALAALAPADDEARTDIASGFGFALQDDSTATERSLPRLRWLDQPASGSIPGLTAIESEAGTSESRELDLASLPALKSTAEAAGVVSSELISAGRVEGEHPQWLVQARPLGDPLSREQPFVPPDSLLLPRWTPGILAIALATGAPDGPIDIERLVELLAARRPMRTLPRRTKPTLRAGAQILVDLGESMQPFRADELDLLSSIGRVLGSAPLEILRFAGCPTRKAGIGDRTTWKRYEPPLTPRPVVVITDLGLGTPVLSRDSSTPEEWRAFASEVRRAGCPLVGFVPFRRERVPRTLRRHFEHIVWDRETTATSAARAVRLAARP